MLNAGKPAPGIVYLLLANTVFAAELVNAPTGIDDLLFARVERVTRRTYFYREVVAEGGTRGELVAATTRYIDVAVIGVNVGFHWNSLRGTGVPKGRVI